MGVGSASILAGLANGFDRGINNYINVKRIRDQERMQKGELIAQAEVGVPPVQVGPSNIDLPAGVTTPSASVLAKPDYSEMDLGNLARLATKNRMEMANALANRKLDIQEKQYDNRSPAKISERQYHTSVILRDMVRREMKQVQGFIKEGSNPALEKYYEALTKKYENLNMEVEKGYAGMMEGRDPLNRMTPAGPQNLSEEYVPSGSLNFNPDGGN